MEVHAPSPSSNHQFDHLDYVDHLDTDAVVAKSRPANRTGQQPHASALRRGVRSCATAVTIAACALSLGIARPASAQSSPSTVPLPQVYSTQIVNSEDVNVVVAKGKTTEVTAAPKPAKPSNTSEVVVSILPAPTTIPVDDGTSGKASKKAKKKKRDAASADAPLVESAIGFPSPIGTTPTTSSTPPTDAKTGKAKKLKASSAESDVPADAVVAKTDTTDTAMSSAFAALRKCESGDNYKANTGNGYFGAYQFAAQTWRALGFSGLPSDATPQTQDEAARKLQAKAGWGQWPACSRKLGLR